MPHVDASQLWTATGTVVRLDQEGLAARFV
jgi:hypothetical protein